MATVRRSLTADLVALLPHDGGLTIHDMVKAYGAAYPDRPPMEVQRLSSLLGSRSVSVGDVRFDRAMREWRRVNAEVVERIARHSAHWSKSHDQRRATRHAEALSRVATARGNLETTPAQAGVYVPPPRVTRPGADDYKTIPSRVGNEQRPYHLATTLHDPIEPMRFGIHARPARERIEAPVDEFEPA